ncbi:hypothetical protein CEP10_02990 [Cylindrospermopsis raciborskii S07]|uniref:Uncharacterized protein n=1 Tax=Cylindrospermopsis raciborskii C07 TaxID=2014886 RepID=A0ABX4WP12_9CYAN|nr:hypothetical protein CEP13_00680 [Cylindrospermopsis raciborskii C03]PNJ98755.1 hypothetical protein CEP14_03765 [Cylindrospermopsis raciborskii C04]PNK00231.1 hypothetical protein CEP15_04165 [Cylindrospermopsis raciborskii C07]PNK06116.1 hypothetical protein CEP11_08500 [Cylindrospermopsis raciborskii S10]PNK09524.1 hypothetical protein CEP12_05685 [Cylindrospermopsis raciborskii S14]PNK10107.1 hypothetical protein CEP10_02990 [Cylindrospermopsis raciborskii S07]PNK17802.1 hypothetical p
MESCLLERAGEYVRLVVIDPKLKRRVIETIIQRRSVKPTQSYTIVEEADQNQRASVSSAVQNQVSSSAFTS